MIFKIAHLVDMVRIAMERNPTPPPLRHIRDPDTEAELLPHIETPSGHIHDRDTITLNQILTHRLLVAANEVYASAPMYMIAESARDIEADIYWHKPVDGTYSGHLILPGDFIRLLVFEMSDWEKPVTEAITPDSVDYSSWYSRYAGVRGTVYQPKCLVCNRSEGRVLEFQSCRSTDACINQAKYIPRPVIDCHGGIEISKAALQAVIAQTLKPSDNER